jgi:putative ABC transport system ATP-binding protein
MDKKGKAEASMIILENIEKSFNTKGSDEVVGLKPFSINIKAGECVSLVGPSGAGKSTLLGLISGDLKPNQGRVWLNGIDYTQKTAYERSSLITQMTQDPRLGTAADFTIEENLALAAKRGERRGLSWALKGCKRKTFIDRLKALDMGLEKRLNALVSTLSGGQRQALSLIMATLSPAKILLLDEPTAALDEATAWRLLGMIQRIIQEQGLTVLQVTHNLEQARQTSSRTIRLGAGGIVEATV